MNQTFAGPWNGCKEGLKIKQLKQQIIWQEDRCTHCGACSVICPAGALV